MNSKDFTDTLSQLGSLGTEEDEFADSGNEGAIEYDDIDSSKTVEEEIADLMAKDTVDGSLDEDEDEDEVCVGTDLEQYIGYEFSSQAATNAWMKWDTKGSH